MPNKMERFTQRARRVLSLAQEEAESLQHAYIGPEHLLLGLIREDGGVASRVLHDLELEQKRLEELVERLTKATTRTSNQLDLSPDTKRILELSVDEARRMGHHYIGTEHLILGLVRQQQTVAIDILKEAGISPEDIRRQVRRVLQENPVQPTQSDEQTTQPATPTRQITSRAAEITERELLLLNASDLIEVVDGEVATTTLNRFAHGVVPGNLYDVLQPSVKIHDLGYVAMDNLIYILLKQDDKIMESRIPDLSFIRMARLSGYDFSGVFPGAPDLAVEIISQYKSQKDSLSRIRDYFKHGSEEAWVVYLEQQEIHVYRRDDSNSIRVYRAGEMLESALFPGLTILVGDLFKLPQ